MKITKSGYHTCIVSYPISRAFRMPLSNLIDIISSISEKTSIIIGSYEDMKLNYPEDSNITVNPFNIGVRSHVLSRIVRFVKFQILALFKFLKIIRNVDIVIFFMQWDPIYFIIISKIFRKQTIWILPSSAPQMRKYHPDHLLAFSQYSEWLSYLLSDVIVVFSTNLIKEWDLVKWKEKIVIAPNHFIDFNQFKITKLYNDRENLVGYVGRLSAEKGVQNFVQALPAFLSDRTDFRVFIGGDGHLKDSIEELLHEENLMDYVKLHGWIPHEDLPHYLNQLRLLVIPSYTEGLPNIMLEAMACGTPVLATPVGAIPDFIRDCETGFILENNSPECIAEKIIKSLNSAEILSVIERAEILVKNEYCFEVVVKRYQQIFNEL